MENPFKSGHAVKAGAVAEPALIDNNTVTQAPLAAACGRAVASLGWSATLTQTSWFFTKAALLTFGGAYAVLPYVNQAAVEHYQWLATAQMMGGLALAKPRQGPSSWWWLSSVLPAAGPETG